MTMFFYIMKRKEVFMLYDELYERNNRLCLCGNMYCGGHNQEIQSSQCKNEQNLMIPFSVEPPKEDSPPIFFKKNSVCYQSCICPHIDFCYDCFEAQCSDGGDINSWRCYKCGASIDGFICVHNGDGLMKTLFNYY